jgi:hypothetical protein
MIILTNVLTWHCSSNQVWEVVFLNEKGQLEYGRGVVDKWAEPTAFQVIERLRELRLTHVGNVKFYKAFVEKRNDSLLAKVHKHARITD